MMGPWRSVVPVALLCVAAACSGGGDGGGGDGVGTIPAIDLDPAFGSISFDNPVKLVQHPTNDDRWYVVEQGGQVWTFLASNPTGTDTIAADVVTQAGVNLGFDNEQGLLGMAFDPGFASSGEIYLTYTDEGADDSVLARWVSSDDGLMFEPDGSPVVLSIPHPAGNHNGGDIMFGRDGFLYYSMGDGGGSDDPDDNGQDPNALLGKILRIDVNSTAPYAIPSGNPFAGNPRCGTGVGTSPCPEIYALGFRNPWRMNFDPANVSLYVGDVGQGAQEEIDLVVIGGNYGWDCFEGTAPHSTNAPCNATFVAPEVVHGRSDARAITGGAVYRGSSISGLRGFYIYGDFLTRLFFAFDTSVADAPAVRLSLPPTSVSAFGQGRDGEVYVVGFDTPSIQKIVPGSG
jgi:glucose/arabinose dehydrogenase